MIRRISQFSFQSAGKHQRHCHHEYIPPPHTLPTHLLTGYKYRSAHGVESRELQQRRREGGGVVDLEAAQRGHVREREQQHRQDPFEEPPSRGDLGDPYVASRQTLQGSFSAVAKPNFASTKVYTR